MSCWSSRFRCGLTRGTPKRERVLALLLIIATGDSSKMMLNWAVLTGSAPGAAASPWPLRDQPEVAHGWVGCSELGKASENEAMLIEEREARRGYSCGKRSGARRHRRRREKGVRHTGRG
jgi:hypothetical protein